MKTTFILSNKDIPLFKEALNSSGGYHYKKPDGLSSGNQVVFLEFDTNDQYMVFSHKFHERNTDVVEVKTNKFKKFRRRVGLKWLTIVDVVATIVKRSRT